MKVEGAITKTEVVFEIKLPLVDQQFFELFKITPIPTIKNNTIITIKPDSSHLAASPHKDQFITFKADDITSCLKAKHDVYICRDKQLKLGRRSDIHSCEINIFNNKTTSNCKLTQTGGTSMWTQLQNPNKWIFATTTPTEVSAVCSAETTQFILDGSGIMQIEPTCVVKTDAISIQGNFEESTDLYTSYASLRQIELLSTSREINMVLNVTTDEVKTEVDQLNVLQQKLREATFVHIPNAMNTNSQHHHAVSYTALLLSIILLIVLTSWRIYSTRYNKERTNNNPNDGAEPPVPQPRSIAIDIIDT